METKKVMINGKAFLVTLRRSERHGSKSRAFVWGLGDDLSEANLEAVAKAVGAPTIHTQRGEYPALDKAWDAHNKMIVTLKRAALEAAIGEHAKGARFSRKAGCSMCPCSPGFILEVRSGQDMYISEVVTK